MGSATEDILYEYASRRLLPLVKILDSLVFEDLDKPYGAFDFFSDGFRYRVERDGSLSFSFENGLQARIDKDYPFVAAVARWLHMVYFESISPSHNLVSWESRYFTVKLPDTIPSLFIESLKSIEATGVDWDWVDMWESGKVIWADIPSVFKNADLWEKALIRKEARWADVPVRFASPEWEKKYDCAVPMEKFAW